MGPHAVLVEDLPIDPAAWSRRLRSVVPPGAIDVVPAAETVLIRCDSEASVAAVVRCFDDVAGPAIAADLGDPPHVVIDVVYDGLDLDEVAAATGLSVNDVVERHCGPTYEVAFCGFAPGFAYLRGLPPELHLPRRATPRARVPAGSVAIAHEYSAVYPTGSPGGWHLLGRTDRRLFDVDDDPPAVLQPGTRVEFRVR